VNPIDGYYGVDQATIYDIRVLGRLNHNWSKSLSGMTISTYNLRKGVQATRLTGNLIDQAALFGVLNTLYNLGFQLLSVERVNPSQ